MRPFSETGNDLAATSGMQGNAVRAKCRLCRGDNTRLLFVAENVHGRHVLGAEKFGVYDCLDCRATFTDINLTDDYYRRYYADDYYPDTAGNWLLDRIVRGLQWLSMRRALRLINKYRPSGNRILEIGCAQGKFLHALPSQFEKHGVEVNRHACEHIKKNYREITVYNTKIGKDCGESIGSKFDIIVMWHVFEHVDNPHEFIECLSRHLLNRNGLLIFDVPNRSSIGFRLAGKRWYHLDTPRHLYHYRYEALAPLLKMHGLRILKHTGNAIDYFQDLSVSLYGRAKGGNAVVNLCLAAAIIPVGLLLRLFFALVSARYAEITTYVVTHEAGRDVASRAV